jgi:hypothetical protein
VDGHLTPLFLRTGAPTEGTHLMARLRIEVMIIRTVEQFCPFPLAFSQASNHDAEIKATLGYHGRVPRGFDSLRNALHFRGLHS